jgi:hypothetical protein
MFIRCLVKCCKTLSPLFLHKNHPAGLCTL